MNLVEFLFEDFDPLYEFFDLSEIDFLAVVFADLDGRAAAVFARFQRFRDSSPCGDHHLVVEDDVADDADLAAEHHIFAGLR